MNERREVMDEAEQRVFDFYVNVFRHIAFLDELLPVSPCNAVGSLIAVVFSNFLFSLFKYHGNIALCDAHCFGNVSLTHILKVNERIDFLFLRSQMFHCTANVCLIVRGFIKKQIVSYSFLALIRGEFFFVFAVNQRSKLANVCVVVVIFFSVKSK